MTEVATRGQIARRQMKLNADRIRITEEEAKLGRAMDVTAPLSRSLFMRMLDLSTESTRVTKPYDADGLNVPRIATQAWLSRPAAKFRLDSPVRLMVSRVSMPNKANNYTSSVVDPERAAATFNPENRVLELHDMGAVSEEVRLRRLLVLGEYVMDIAEAIRGQRQPTANLHLGDNVMLGRPPRDDMPRINPVSHVLD